MGYFDGMVSSGFQKSDDGKMLFFPHGKFGKGYIVDEAKSLEIQKFLKRYYIVMFIVIGVMGGMYGICHYYFSKYIGILIYGIAVGVLLLPPYYIKVAKLIKGIEPHKDSKFSIKTNMKNVSSKLGLKTNIILTIMDLCMFSLSIFAYIITEKLSVTIFGMIVFGIITILQGTMLVTCIKNKRSKDN